MKFKQLIKHTTIAATLVLIAGLSPSVDAKTLRCSYQNDMASLDPMVLNETFTLGLQSWFYETLTGFDKDLKLIPLLAEKWENPEPTKWIFYLRQGVKFHDGSPFTADDVIFSWERSKTPGSNIKNYPAKAAHIKKIDDHTIEITTRTPNPILPRDWTFLYIMSKTWAEKNKVTTLKGGESNYADLHENGTGPFTVVDRQPDVKTTLKRFDEYWNKDIATNITDIVFRPIPQESTRVAALISGEIDIAIPIPVHDWPRLEKEPNVEVMNKPEARSVFIGMDQHRDELLYSNVKDKNPFKDKRVRQAFVLAVDTDAINQQVMHGAAKPLGTLIADRINGYDESFGAPYKTDVEKAKKLLTEAGYPDGFSVQLDCPNDRYVNDEKVCQAVSNMLARIGIKIDLLVQTKSKHFAKVLLQAGNDTSMYLLGWTPSSIDAAHTLTNLVSCWNAKTVAGQFNLGGYCNKEIDALTTKINVETDQVKRNAMIKEAFTMLRNDYGYLPLHQQPISWGIKKGIKLAQRADDVLDIRNVVLP